MMIGTGPRGGGADFDGASFSGAQGDVTMPIARVVARTPQRAPMARQVDPSSPSALIHALASVATGARIVRLLDPSSPGVPRSLAWGAAAVRWPCIVAALAAVVGCGGSKQATYRAGGKVAFSDGKPLPGGWVSFRSLDHEKHVTARGPVQPDGTFELTTYKPGDGAVEGRHQVVVTPPVRGDRGDLVAGVKAPPAAPIDRKFSNYETSELEFAVTDDPEQNQFKITVTPPR